MLSLKHLNDSSSSNNSLICLFMQLLQAYRSFGDAELETLKRRVQENREMLLKVKEIQALQEKQAETYMLSALKKAVENMEKLKHQADADSKSAQDSLKALESRMERQMTLEEKKKTAELLTQIDFEKILNPKTKR